MNPDEATLEGLLALVERMSAQATHVPCPEGSGALAPLAQALNHLSEAEHLARAALKDPFGTQALLAQNQSYMFVCDTDARIVLVNRHYAGITSEMTLGTSVYQWIVPDSIERLRVLIARILSGGEGGAFMSETTGAIDHTWYAGMAHPIKAGDQVVGFTLIVDDITELKRSQQRLERSNQELESFAYVASHDLQEPLRKIQTFGERLATTCSASLSPEGRDDIARMQQTATRMRGLIDALLSFSRLSFRSRPFIPVDLDVVAREALGGLGAMLEKTRASVTLGKLPVLDAEPAQMRLLLDHLLGNALKFRREGSPPRVDVRARVDERTQECELVVEDNGTGFEEKDAERIFEMFKRLHRGPQDTEGTGMGLALCRKIVERHGGRITAHGTPGQGATFRVTLPLVQTRPP